MAELPVMDTGRSGSVLTRPTAIVLAAIEAQRGHLFPWVPVFFGAGIGLWFALKNEPGQGALITLSLAASGAAMATRIAPERLRPLAVAAVMVAAGLLVASLRSALVAAPVLEFRYYGPVEGRIVKVDRSSTDRLRLLLDQVVLSDLAPSLTPELVRISVHSKTEPAAFDTGARVILTANLSPPQGPLEPGDFDFRRHAWFEGLGAVGYTRTPVLLIAAPEGGGTLWINRVRQSLAQAVQERIPGDAGGLAAAVTTGDRSGLSQEANDAMRDSNLYHLVSISGMHMGMLATFVFALVRYGLAAVPPLALRLPAKKIAAVIALAASAFYLALAGRDVPTERAFVMVAVMLAAVLLDRRALSLRSVAIAAFIVLSLRPETLVNPGFQMSFAATIALVAAFEAGRENGVTDRLRAFGWARGAATLVASSFVAGAATAPFAAVHFNQVAEYGLIANLLAVPAMGVLVMPGAVILALTGPLGLDYPAVWMIEAGSRWILFVAETVSSWEGAVRGVASPPPAVLPLMAVGGLLVVIWRGAGRLIGMVPVGVAFALWYASDRPDLLVAPDGGTVGVMTPEGRALSGSPTSLAARGWLENDGEPEPRADRPGFGERDMVAVARVGEVEVAHLFGRGWRDRLAEACTTGRILVTAQEVSEPPSGGCILYDARRLSHTGAVAGWLAEDGSLRLVHAREAEGARPWIKP